MMVAEDCHPGVWKVRLAVGIPHPVFSSALRSGRREHPGPMGLIPGAVVTYLCCVVGLSGGITWHWAWTPTLTHRLLSDLWNCIFLE